MFFANLFDLNANWRNLLFCSVFSRRSTFEYIFHFLHARCNYMCIRCRFSVVCWIWNEWNCLCLFVATIFFFSFSLIAQRRRWRRMSTAVDWQNDCLTSHSFVVLSFLQLVCSFVALQTFSQFLQLSENERENETFFARITIAQLVA